MSTAREGHVAAAFYNIHHIITRGLRVSMDSVQGVLQQGFEDEGRREGLFHYIRALSAVLHSHHMTEDEVAFPYFRDKMPEAPFDTLIAWHQEMVGMLHEIERLLEKCEQNEQLETNLKGLLHALAGLDESWQPHIQMETDEFITKADALIPVEEQLRLTGLFAEHGLKIAVPHYWTIPFLLYNLPPEDRRVFSQPMPAEVLEHLVPVVWKEQWASMKPYLLE